MTDEDYRTELLAKETAAMEAAVGGYAAFHAARFAFVVAKCRALRPDRTARILDVGRSYLSLELLRSYDDVTTIGFPLQPHDFTGIDDAAGRRRTLGDHIAYDLNEAQHAPPVHTGAAFDVIVFAEVVEHLHTAPELTLAALKTLMKPGGYMIVQTPNAAAFHKRMMLLAGHNPYERIRINPYNPGHFREYTRRELLAYAAQVGLEVVGHEYCEYFRWTPVPGGRATHVLYRALVAAMPSLSRGQTLVLRRPFDAAVA